MVASSDFRKGLLAIAAALALTVAMIISATTAEAQGVKGKRAYCHGTGSASNPYVLVVVQNNSAADQAHNNHANEGRDVRLGPVANRQEAQILFDAQCSGGTTDTTTTGTDTTTTGTDTTTTGTDTTTTGTDTTTTGQYTTTTGTDTTTTGTDTTTTGTGTTTTGTTGPDTTTTTGQTTGQTTSQTTGQTTSATTGSTTSVTTTGDVIQIGQGNIACVQTAVNQEVDKDQTAISQFGDATNFNVQSISQECDIAVEQVNTIINEFLTVNEAGEVVIVSTASASASASASAPSAVQYQYSSSDSSSGSTPEGETTVLPDTGGASLITIGAMVLLLGGGLTAFFVMRRGTV